LQRVCGIYIWQQPLQALLDKIKQKRSPSKKSLASRAGSDNERPSIQFEQHQAQLNALETGFRSLGRMMMMMMMMMMIMPFAAINPLG